MELRILALFAFLQHAAFIFKKRYSTVMPVQEDFTMPASFYNQIKLLKRYSVVETFGSLLIVVWIILVIAMWNKSIYISVGFIIALVVSALLLYYFSVDKHRKVIALEPYHILIPEQSVQEIVNSLEAKEVSKDAYVSFLNCSGLSIRILSQFAPHFLPNELAKQRKTANRNINRIYHITSDVSSWSAHSMLRINLIVCQEESEQLLVWLQRDADRLLSRVESIINVAVLPEKGMFLFPSCVGDLSLVQLKKYQVAGELLYYRLTKR